ncbi:DUF72 domain-containing protein [Taibaiella chishuiensis]|uniref:Uncharacterized protein YecE (DUF72 family) n=1 Tax=Taibaiella chishuiensis TaxID=1434707 RepID=A0A2P8CT21_9BACT|nr:DUF72 domain-containing protein [Taibaiella chishuiensis]PSK88114.1 uncharacterized protein YecE (DUF72 family) [Taibaiella chishuiensis]
MIQKANDPALQHIFPEGLFMGTSGLLLPYKNMSFYPVAFTGKSRLAVYALLNNSIEINSSFYKIPRKATVAKWNDSVQPGFKFTFKLIRTVTHTKGAAFPSGDVERFMESINAIEQDKQGCILVQFPASFRISQWQHFASLLSALHARNQDQHWSISVELRDPSWYREETITFLEQRAIGIVIHDKATGASAEPEHTDSRHVYLRFHGPEGNYRGSYEDFFLAEYATYIREWLQQQKEVFVYFNNTMGDALSNMNTLGKAIIHA